MSIKSMAKQKRDDMISLAYQTEVFAREKRPKPLAHYLGKTKPVRDNDMSGVASMMGITPEAMKKAFG